MREVSSESNAARQPAAPESMLSSRQPFGHAPHAHSGKQMWGAASDAPPRHASFQWQRSGGAVGEAMDLPESPTAEEGPPWRALLRFANALLPQKSLRGSPERL